MYANRNFSTKAELKRAVANGEQVTVWQPGPFPARTDGEVSVEGPHYPQPHRWYARVEVKNGRIMRVLS